MMVGRTRPRLIGADPINRGLVGFWPLTEHGGTAAAVDVSLYHRSIPAVTAPTYSYGPNGPARLFNGTTQSFYNANVIWPGGQEAAVSVWVNTPGGTNGASWDFGARALITGNGFYSHLPYGDKNAYFYYGGVGSGEISTSFAAYLNKWTHVAWSASATRKAIWINGVKVNESGTVSAAVAAGTGVYLGRSPTGVGYHNGSMQLFRVRSRAWTDGEVSRLYRDPWAGVATNLQPKIRYFGPIVPIPPIGASGGGSSTIWIM